MVGVFRGSEDVLGVVLSEGIRNDIGGYDMLGVGISVKNRALELIGIVGVGGIVEIDYIGLPAAMLTLAQLFSGKEFKPRTVWLHREVIFQQGVDVRATDPIVHAFASKIILNAARDARPVLDNVL